jgi:hypothetical protein
MNLTTDSLRELTAAPARISLSGLCKRAGICRGTILRRLASSQELTEREAVALSAALLPLTIKKKDEKE